MLKLDFKISALEYDKDVGQSSSWDSQNASLSSSLEQIKLAEQLTTELTHKPQVRIITPSKLGYIIHLSNYFPHLSNYFLSPFPGTVRLFSECCLLPTETAAHKKALLIAPGLCHPLPHCRLGDFLNALNIISMNKTSNGTLSKPNLTFSLS